MKAIRSEVPRTRRRGFAFGLLAPVIVVLSLVTPGARSAQDDVFPDLIQLPADFGSEGIAAGPGHTFYVGSFTPPAVGQILVGDLRTGIYTELVPPTGRMAVGMKFDPRSNALFVAGARVAGPRCTTRRPEPRLRSTSSCPRA